MINIGAAITGRVRFLSSFGTLILLYESDDLFRTMTLPLRGVLFNKLL